MMYSTRLFITLALCSSFSKCITAFAPPFYNYNKQQLSHIHPRFATNSDKDKETTHSSDFGNQILQTDPACPIDDEDCLAISSHSSTSLLLDASLYQSLERRSQYLAREPILNNWKAGICPTTKVSISSSDAVRRVCMNQYPLVACGSASGSIYLVDLEEQRVLASVEAHLSIQNNVRGSSDEVKKQAMETLYGKLDGGGVISIAMQGGVVASSGREGGVKLWRIENERAGYAMQLVSVGSLATLQNTIVTSVKFDSTGLLWVSCFDGTVRCYDISHLRHNGNDTIAKNLFPPQKPLHRTDFTDSVLDMHLCEELNIGVCATSDGGAALFSLENGQFFVGIMLFGVAARSVSIVKHGGDGEINVDMNGNREYVSGFSVLCGGMDGTIHRIPLNIGTGGEVDVNNPFAVTDETETAIRPRHVGPVMCLASPGEGVFVSGGQDGALRVWSIGGLKDETADGETSQSKHQQGTLAKCSCIYALTGYKLWLGSACTDGDKLVSDGGENNIIVRDYSRKRFNEDATGR